MDEKTLFAGHGIDHAYREEDLTEQDLMRAYGALLEGKHQCPGDLKRGCGVWIPTSRLRCHFCMKTIELRLASK